MEDLLEKKIGVQIEYDSRQENMKINMDNSDLNYYAKLKTININPRIVSLHKLEINKNSIKMDMTTPIVCNLRNLSESGSYIAGIKFEGEDKYKFLEKIEETARSFGPEWEDAVQKRKEEILRRNKFIK